LLLSAGTAGLFSASITYDLDTSPVSRKKSPHIYGFISNTERGVAYTTLVALSSLHILAKGVTTALLVVTNTTWLLLYLAFDMALYFAYKVLMRDFIVYVTSSSSIESFIVSIFYRIITKTLADFTGCATLRLPDELGGAYFTFNLVTSQVSVLVSLWLYNVYYEAPNDEPKLPAETTWAFAVSTISLWVLTFAFFVTYVCDPKHRSSFFSLRTGWRHSAGYFLDFEPDSTRILIFECNLIQWKSIAGEVQKWTLDNWEKWEREKPEWFTPHVVSNIPDDFIPPRFLAHLGATRARRGSAAQIHAIATA
jgi:hypothetical protein